MRIPSFVEAVTTVGCLTTICHALPSRNTRRSQNSNITAGLEDIRAQYQLPALAAAVGPQFQAAAVGTRKIDTDANVTIHDIFHLGSNAKAMTATVLAMLIEGGDLTWETTLQEILTDYEILEPYQSVTIELLSSHRSGITDDAALADPNFLTSLYNVSAAEGRQQMAALTLKSEPTGEQGVFTYANLNYVLIGLIMDIVTGEKAEDVIFDLLLRPLGTCSAGWGPTPQSTNTSIDNPWGHVLTEEGIMAVGDGEENRLRDLPPVLNTAGLIHMTLQDWNKFLTVHLDAATTGEGSKLLNLSAESFLKLHSVGSGPSIAEFPGRGYTYGGFLRSTEIRADSGYSLEHCGSNDRNYACTSIDTTLNAIFMSATNIAGEAGNLGATDVLAALRNGTLVF